MSSDGQSGLGSVISVPSIPRLSLRARSAPEKWICPMAVIHMTDTGGLHIGVAHGSHHCKAFFTRRQYT